MLPSMATGGGRGILNQLGYAAPQRKTNNEPKDPMDDFNAQMYKTMLDGVLYDCY